MPQPHPFVFWFFIFLCLLMLAFVLYIFGVGGKRLVDEVPADVVEPTQEEFDSKE
jgi:Na+-transporting methylmalonyl-CoA/oxaloacetate decarboxylase gamma subunit